MKAPRRSAHACLERLLGEPLLAWRRLAPDYAGHTNHVWSVETPTRRLVVRLPRRRAERVAGSTAFWAGVRRLFGLRPDDVAAIAEGYLWLSGVEGLPVPRPLSLGLHPRPHLVVEWLAGRMPRSLDGLGDQLGSLVALLHSRRSRGWGRPGAAERPPARFHPALQAAMAEQARGLAEAKPALKVELARAEAALRALPAPGWMAPVLLDWDHSQLLVDRGRVSGIVDLDALAVAPRELDLAAWELLLPPAEAAAFQEAYRRRLPWPALAPVRQPYRLWLWLIEFQGRVPLDDWLARPGFADPAGAAISPRRGS
ncbi:MAG: phosphotransferase [Bacillota bacterium]|nr:phosphotransferase [Bacillota bacterium]